MSTIYNSDFFSTFLRCNDRVLSIAKVVHNFFLYDKLIIPTNKLIELNLLQSFLEDSTIAQLIIENRIVFEFEPNWGIFINVNHLERDLYYSPKGIVPDKYIGYTYQNLDGYGTYEQLVRNYKKEHSVTPLEEIVLEHMQKTTDEDYVAATEKYIKQAKISTINCLNVEIKEKEFFSLAQQIHQRAYFIRDLDKSRIFNSHIDLESKSRWFALKNDISTEKSLVSLGFEKNMHNQTLLDFPNFYHTLSGKITTPDKLLKASNDEWAKDFRGWFQDQIERDQKNIRPSTNTQKILYKFGEYRQIFKWVFVNLLSNIPIVGPFIGAGIGLHDLNKNEQKKIPWKPRIYLGSQFSSKNPR